MNINIVLIRHGLTSGNLEKRYIGTTDEELCKDGVLKLKENVRKGMYPDVQGLYVSPMKRCVQTADIIYPDKEQIVVPDFKECDFGTFEGKNYKELTGNADYQRWIDSNATLPFPDGEDVKDFRKRCVDAFYNMILHIDEYSVKYCDEHNNEYSVKHCDEYSDKYSDEHCDKHNDKQCSEKSELWTGCVVHGGTIMSILSYMCGGDYYDYHCENGRGYICRISMEDAIKDNIKDTIRMDGGIRCLDIEPI